MLIVSVGFETKSISTRCINPISCSLTSRALFNDLKQQIICYCFVWCETIILYIITNVKFNSQIVTTFFPVVFTIKNLWHSLINKNLYILHMKYLIRQHSQITHQYQIIT